MTRVLVVEDDEMIRELLCRRLQQAGFETVAAESGERGIALACELQPAIILTDLAMPGIDGWETTKRLKADPATKSIPVIAVTAHAMPGDREKAQQAGCDEYETKPVQMPKLLEKMRTLLAAKGVALPQPKSAPKAPPTPLTDTVAIPRPTSSAPQAPSLVPATTFKEGDSCPVMRKRILVVEDNDTNREMLARRLSKQGFQVSEAPGGREALDLVRREPFDLILLDIMMPEMDGFQVLELLKSDTELREVPVLMISALDTMDSVVRCIEMGAEDYLTKPYDPVLLQARIAACIDKKRMRDQELAYLRAVTDLTAAAASVEKGNFESSVLAAVAARDDELGRLARVFERMALEVIAREQLLRREVEQLRVEIDEKRKSEQVAEITDNTYFQSLQDKVQMFRRRARKGETGQSSAIESVSEQT